MLHWDTALFSKNSSVKISQMFRDIISSFRVYVHIEYNKRNNRENNIHKNVLHKPEIPCAENVF